jgi:predicted XRE-type DNA-binding protein
MDERWLPIENFPGYEVSDLGRVRSYRKRAGKEPKIISIGKNSSGYMLATLRHESGNEKSVAVHRFVLIAFVGPCPETMECCHENGVRHDNRLTNLRWDNHKGNMSDRSRHGTHTRGQSIGNSKLKEAETVELIALLENTSLSYAAVAEKFGVSITHVSRIAQQKSWSHLKRSAPVSARKPGTSKVKATDVLTIRRLLADGVSQRKIATQFGVHQSNISLIKTSKAWAEVK